MGCAILLKGAKGKQQPVSVLEQILGRKGVVRQSCQTLAWSTRAFLPLWFDQPGVLPRTGAMTSSVEQHVSTNRPQRSELSH